MLRFAMFMLRCSLAFMLPCTLAFAFAGLVVGLGDPVTIVLALALLFELSAVLQAAPKRAKADKVKKLIVRRIDVPPV